MRKRERQDDALSDNRVKQIVESNDAAAAYAVFSRLSPNERRLFIERAFATDAVFKPFYGIPLDLIRIIATMTPGTLMKLALTMDPFFIALARNDTVWQELYRRDFPQDYRFCRGVLPFFVLEPTHPFYTPGSVSKFDISPWKRYYLHTADNYRRVCDYVRGCLEYADEKDDSAWLFDSSGATSRQVYDWCHEYAMSRNYESFDRRATLAWIFVCLFVWYISPEGTFFQENFAIANHYILFARSHHWLFRYVLHMRPQIQSQRKDDDMWGELSNFPLFGPLLQSKDLQIIAKKYHPIQIEWNSLFSNSDRGHLESFITTSTLSVTLNPAFEGLSFEDRENRNQIFMRCWNLLVDCYRIPCATSLQLVDSYGVYNFSDVSMARNSEEIRQKIQTLISNANGRLIMDLNMENLNTPIFNFPEFTEARTIIDPWFLISQSNIFHQHTMIYQLKTRYEKKIFEENSKAPRMDQGREPISYIEQHICLQCGTVPAIPQQCGGTCQQAIYCGVECQRVHWVSEHHNECKKK